MTGSGSPASLQRSGPQSRSNPQYGILNQPSPRGVSANLSSRLWNFFGIPHQEFWFKLFQALAKSCHDCEPATTALRSASLNSAGGNTRLMLMMLSS